MRSASLNNSKAALLAQSAPPKGMVILAPTEPMLTMRPGTSAQQRQERLDHRELTENIDVEYSTNSAWRSTVSTGADMPIPALLTRPSRPTPWVTSSTIWRVLAMVPISATSIKSRNQPVAGGRLREPCAILDAPARGEDEEASLDEMEGSGPTDPAGSTGDQNDPR